MKVNIFVVSISSVKMRRRTTCTYETCARPLHVIWFSHDSVCRSERLWYRTAFFGRGSLEPLKEMMFSSLFEHDILESSFT